MAGSLRAYEPAGGADRPPVGRTPRLMEGDGRRAADGQREGAPRASLVAANTAATPAR